MLWADCAFLLLCFWKYPRFLCVGLVIYWYLLPIVIRATSSAWYVVEEVQETVEQWAVLGALR